MKSMEAYQENTSNVVTGRNLCAYSDRSGDPAARRDHVAAIEKRIRQEEAKSRALSIELARLRSAKASRDRDQGSSLAIQLLPKMIYEDQYMMYSKLHFE